MASNSEAEFKRHYTQVCHCEWSEDEFTRQTTSENCVMHGNVPDPLAALLAERQQAVKALRRLVQEVENECRGRPSKQRLRHRAAVARRELAALADKEETE